jgi:poly(A) polymerase
VALPAIPRILPRAEHILSRKDIDSDALKVLYRLKNHAFTAYLVGGGVRDLLLGRRPKDFDIGTSAVPQQVKRLFRNCFIIGRRFRLCHVRFGPRKVVEVSTFRKLTEPGEGDPLIRRDNTFGTPEQDAFRRDFTVNALFYDIATFSVIDYVGGLQDLRERVIRTIGDPDVRFREDPVRMLRAVALAARLDFTIDRDTREAIRALRGEIVKSSPARLLDEFYKILRQGAARRTFESLHEIGLLAYLLPEADQDFAGGGTRLLDSLQRLDEFRNGGAGAEKLSNALLAGTLLVPLGLQRRSVRTRPQAPPLARDGDEPGPAEAEPAPEPPDDVATEIAALGAADEDALAAAEARSEPEPLNLPFARRDLDRVRLMLAAQRRLNEAAVPARLKRVIASRPYFEDALVWTEVHGGPDGPALAAHWRSLDTGDVPPPASAGAAATPALGLGESWEEPLPMPRRRRRRRRRRRGNGGNGGHGGHGSAGSQGS